MPKENAETSEVIAHSTFKCYKGEFVEEKQKGWQRTRLAVAASGTQSAKGGKEKKKESLEGGGEERRGQNGGQCGAKQGRRVRNCARRL